MLKNTADDKVALAGSSSRDKLFSSSASRHREDETGGAEEDDAREDGVWRMASGGAMQRQTTPGGRD
ncbi:hypothetical protein GUJ93_ZPchr0008g14158 [Zizania palustris]|uniref:Uncharacterized protein n=1 Tax=Zizania palustris TaxID=103762 RepID=A0A8J5UWL4_ZIZPA|nr:hypothetical protein GUJ93_ZPchr0008g14158 [Zizania palustris]